MVCVGHLEEPFVQHDDGSVKKDEFYDRPRSIDTLLKCPATVPDITVGNTNDVTPHNGHDIS